MQPARAQRMPSARVSRQKRRQKRVLPRDFITASRVAEGNMEELYASCTRTAFAMKIMRYFLILTTLNKFHCNF